MKNTFFLCAMLLLFFVLTGCPDKADDSMSVWFTNNSNEDLFFTYHTSNLDSVCPDTILPQSKGEGIIFKNSFDIEIFATPVCDTIRVFVLSLDTVNKYDWNEVRQKYMVLRRYDITLDEIKKLNSNIEYPPIKSMKDIKMYPPYP